MLTGVSKEEYENQNMGKSTSEARRSFGANNRRTRNSGPEQSRHVSSSSRLQRQQQSAPYNYNEHQHILPPLPPVIPLAGRFTIQQQSAAYNYNDHQHLLPPPPPAIPLSAQQQYYHIIIKFPSTGTVFVDESGMRMRMRMRTSMDEHPHPFPPPPPAIPLSDDDSSIEYVESDSSLSDSTMEPDIIYID